MLIFQVNGSYNRHCSGSSSKHDAPNRFWRRARSLLQTDNALRVANILAMHSATKATLLQECPVSSWSQIFNIIHQYIHILLLETQLTRSTDHKPLLQTPLIHLCPSRLRHGWWTDYLQLAFIFKSSKICRLKAGWIHSLCTLLHFTNFAVPKSCTLARQRDEDNW